MTCLLVLTFLHGYIKFSLLQSRLTNAVSLHVALVRHAVPPQTLVGIVSRQPVLHPIVSCSGDHQQDIAHYSTEQTPSHETVHLELIKRCHGRATEREKVHAEVYSN